MQVHANAPWTPRRRCELIGAVHAGRLSIEAAGVLGGVSTRTVYKWLARWRAGDRELADRGSAAHSHPNATPGWLVELIATLRQQRWTTPQLAFHLRMAQSTVTAICRRLGLGRLGPACPPEPANRYCRRHAGELVHLDIKQLGRLGQVGHRIHHDRSRRSRGVGWEYAHVAVDDATRLAYVEVLTALTVVPQTCSSKFPTSGVRDKGGFRDGAWVPVMLLAAMHSSDHEDPHTLDVRSSQHAPSREASPRRRSARS